METTQTAKTGGFWMETELLFPERKGFDPVVIYPEKGVVFMRTDRDSDVIEKENETVKVIAI